MLMGEWKEYKLKDVIDKFIDYRGKTPPKTDSGIPLITAKVVKGGRILKPTEFIAEDYYTQWMTRGYPEINDVVLTTEAPLGEVALLRDNKIALAQRVITLRGKKELCDNAFLKYYLQSNIGQATLQARAQGSTVEGIKSAELREVSVSLPPLPEQKSISSILSSLDNKIDLLHRQNKTLEALAETLFRQWFVEEAEEGWESGKLGDCVQFVKGKKPKEAVEEYSFGLAPQILIETFDTGKTLFAEPQNMVIANEKDILMVMDGASSGRAEIGFTGIVGSTIGLFKPISSFNYPLFIFYLLKARESHIREHTTGSAIPHADKALILDLDIQYSSIERIIEFEKMAEGWFEKKKANRNQIRTLTRLRDTILPKLMSGEVSVKDAGQLMEKNV